MSHIDVVSALDWISRVTTVLFLVTLISGIFLWAKGILPVLIRLGNGLSKRKIAIFAKGDNLRALENVLADSKLFNKENVITISSNGDIGRAEQTSLFLVFWHDWPNEMTEILRMKKTDTALVVYAQQDLGRIPDDRLKELNSKPNVTIANMRGRLLNDIVVSLMTTSYQ